ncbi:MAG: hypothetical protein HZA22_11785 [Nitrospirae bacterium]|nr:hypothetical protein [Nitrospirota bacterium]MBI5696463.1 hypothetical protein [Nitrospirota bacterium]
MRKSFAIMFALAAAALFAGRAVAGIVGSPHDISAQRYTLSREEEDLESQEAASEKKDEKKNVCNFCHVPHKAKGARLWATAPPSLKGWGKVGPLCYSCHDGVAIVSPYVDASRTAFHPLSHGLKLPRLPEGDDAAGSGLPYAEGNDEESMECSTCHNPHDNTNRPFIRKPITEICLECHKDRENSGYGVNNVEGTHPVHKLPADETEGSTPIDVVDDFRTVLPDEYPSEDGKYTLDVHWTLGGKLSEGDQGLIECTTCHSVHGKEGIGPVSENLLSMDPVLQSANEFCEGCHRGERYDGLPEPPFPNPGGTEFYHPADNDQRNGIGRVVEIVQPPGWQFGVGGEVLCTTCHKSHRAMKESPILRPLVNSETFCEECHSVPFQHHVTGDLTKGVSEVSSGKEGTKTREVKVPDSFPAGYTYGSPKPNWLYCSSCHGAHNVNCFLIKSAECKEGSVCALCTMCHEKFNPTWQTDDTKKATHFMGDPTAETIDKVNVDGVIFGTQRGYADQYPPLKKDEWPDSHQVSSYGGADGVEVDCCSCHTFKVGNITAGDADQSPYMGPIVGANYQPGDLTSGLLALAGSYKEWLDSDTRLEEIGGDRGTVQKVDRYLCTGCHGLTPNSHPDSQFGEGFTHPMMEADGSKTRPLAPINLSFNNHINCESCHKPHEADSRGGFYILRETELNKFIVPAEQQTVPDPYVIRKREEIEFAPLCQKCHINY